MQQTSNSNEDAGPAPRKLSLPVSSMSAPPTPAMPAPGPSSSSAATSSMHLSKPGLVGTRVPNRVFIGGIPAGTAETELMTFFSSFGTVRNAKVIVDPNGQPKGYGFVTFETDEEANALLKEVELEGGSLPFKDRRLNISEAVRKLKPMMPYESFDPNARPPGMMSHHHQANRSAVISGMMSPVDPNLPCSLLSQIPGPGVNVNDVMGGVGMPCSGSSAGGHPHPVVYNYFYPHPNPPMTPGYPMDVGLGVGQAFGNGGQMSASGGAPWQQSSEQFSWGFPGHPHSMPPMMYPHQTAHGLLADTPPLSDMSSWSSGGSCASSTCSTGSFGGGGGGPGGDGPDAAAAAAQAAAQAMLPYFCVPDGNGMMYVPYAGPLPGSSTVSVGPVSGSSQTSPLGLANGSVDEAEKATGDFERKDENRCAGASSEPNTSEAPPSGSTSTTTGRSLAAKIRDRRKAQMSQGKGIDPNNNCQRNGNGSGNEGDGSGETPVISVSKILEGGNSRSPSPSVTLRESGKLLPSPLLPGVPTSTMGPMPSYLPPYQYCPPQLPHQQNQGLPGPISVNTCSQYPFAQNQSVYYNHNHNQSHAQQHQLQHQHQHQPLYPPRHGANNQGQHQQQNLQYSHNGPMMVPGMQPPHQQMPQFQNQFVNQFQRRSSGSNDSYRYRSGQQAAGNYHGPGPKNYPKMNGPAPMVGKKMEKPQDESRTVVNMVENMSIS